MYDKAAFFHLLKSCPLMTLKSYISAQKKVVTSRSSVIFWLVSIILWMAFVSEASFARSSADSGDFLT